MIEYIFTLEDGTRLNFEVDENASSTPPAPEQPPAWTLLGLSRCDHCPLPEDAAVCPAALAIMPVVEAFQRRISFETLHCLVRMGEVTLEASIPTQEAVRSVVGLLLALSDCPMLARLRPMAVFHQPFASREQTVFRALGSYLLAQFLRRDAGLEPDWYLEGLRQLYSDLHKVNSRLAERLRAASEGDANVNSLVMLDTLAHAVDTSFERNVERLKPAFQVFLRD